ncbi:MAG: hypothetical protein J0J01_19855 [Reyranella sp.]|uniref:hypothetical protein n=1 Tax=Reyranella sp. TaxID=1929291 RepID=UPI001ACC7C8B|nr:hypothetical protein [Reyranella sp.]MBN9089167.1 hypothetical protein [Reyranella sp.]
MDHSKKPPTLDSALAANVTVAALTDLERQRIAHAERAALLRRDPAAEHPDRPSMRSPETVEMETRPVRFEITFGDPLRVREQADMLIATLNEIKVKTQEHHLGAIRQRMACRQIADVGRRLLTRYNGKLPSGEARRTPRT